MPTPLPAPRDFTDRVAIVTGAARGLGRAVAERLHERGASVGINVRDAERAERVARRSANGPSPSRETSPLPTRPTIVQRTLKRFNRIDILINNAALPLTT